MPSRRQASCASSITFSTRSRVTASHAWRSETCVETCTTRRLPAASIIVKSLVPVKWAKISVWPGKLWPGGDEGFLVDRRGDGRVDLAGRGELDHRPHRLERRVARHRGDFAELEALDVDVLQVVHVDRVARRTSRRSTFATGRTRQRRLRVARRVAHDARIADDDRPAELRGPARAPAPSAMISGPMPAGSPMLMPMIGLSSRRSAWSYVPDVICAAAAASSARTGRAVP